MAPVWAKALVFAAFAVSSAEELATCEQECDHEVSLLQVETQFKKARAHQHTIAEVDDSVVLMQTEAEVTEASSLFELRQKAKAAALFAAGSSLLAPKASEVNSYFKRRAEQKLSQTKAAHPTVSGLHGLASLASLGSIFAPNEQVGEYLKLRAQEEKNQPNEHAAAAPVVSALSKRKTASLGASLGAITGSVLAPKSQEVHAYMKRRAEVKMQQKMQQKYRTVMMVVPASGVPARQAVLEDRAALSVKDEFAAAAVALGAAAAVAVAAAR